MSAKKIESPANVEKPGSSKGWGFKSPKRLPEILNLSGERSDILIRGFIDPP